MNSPQTPAPAFPHEGGWLVECVSAFELDTCEADARATLMAVFGPEWADAPLEAEDADLGLWLTAVPPAVEAAVLRGDDWADTAVALDAHGHEMLHSVLVPASF